ncbi:methyltransferase domain-containing protein [Streptomyces sp. CBMA123]|uniref:methyltransferase domain-containing protein n=1 Tax=Streptomyces sp. CBMA123 TaxID=1896313 RepID=UPI001661BA0B|nr:methyltransferase domain-containing protein [Streptomyces sp. CBMA123]MBD0691683.1 methyltransferase [Streptomyces sp. CBMA123]
MTAHQPRVEQASVGGLLHAVSQHLGHDLAPEWRGAAEAAPRHRFLPDRVWLSGDDEALTPCDRVREPDRWLAAAYGDVPVVTQVDDGREPEDPADASPSSSASAPSIVFRMLELLELAPGMRVLEIGAGTGYNAALLSHRLGDANVTTIEIDPAVAGVARSNLKAAGFSPTLVGGDGGLGWSTRAPYDRVVATCSVRRIPYAWVEQTRPGGVILTPWCDDWSHGGLLRLTVGDDGTATGRFSADSAFMLMRTQRRDLRLFRDVVMDDHVPVESATGLSPWAVADSSFETQFALGLRLGDLWYAWHHDPDVDGVETRLWVATADGDSWAAVDWDGTRAPGRYTVWQHGPRRLWGEVEAAHRWWLDNGRPGPDRLGLTVTPDGQWAWLDDPVDAWPLG